MASEKNASEGSGINRRNFIKSAGVAVAGGTLGAGLKLTPEAAAVDSVPTTITNFRCPIDSKDFGTSASEGAFCCGASRLRSPGYNQTQGEREGLRSID